MTCATKVVAEIGDTMSSSIESQKQSVLEKWINNVLQAAPGGSEKIRSALNRSAYVIGMQIPRGKVDEKQAAADLIQAGIKAGLNRAKAEETVRLALQAGK